MTARRLRWAISQTGPKPGKEEALGMLVDADELPGGGWHVLDERTWRTGESDRQQPWAVRARKIKSVSAWRSFEQPTLERWLWLQAVPLASADDASVALAELPSRFLENERAEVRVVANEVAHPDVPTPGPSWAQVQHTTGPRGSGRALIFGWCLDRVVLAGAWSSSAEPWSWDEVACCVRAQNERLGVTS